MFWYDLKEMDRNVTNASKTPAHKLGRMLDAYAESPNCSIFQGVDAEEFERHEWHEEISYFRLM